jgi:hypothetical protein
VSGVACLDGAGPEAASKPRASARLAAWTALLWLIAARLLLALTGGVAPADTPADTPAMAATVAAATPSVSREGRRAERQELRNEDSDEGRR